MIDDSREKNPGGLKTGAKLGDAANCRRALAATANTVARASFLRRNVRERLLSRRLTFIQTGKGRSVLENYSLQTFMVFIAVSASVCVV
jgi:hypothetical protein